MTATRTILLLCLLVGIACAQQLRRPSTRKPPPQRQRQPTPLVEEEESEFSDECPEPNGFFADEEQCDKYYACEEGKITEKLCPDGMVFNDYSPKHEKCDLPFGIDCSQRPKLQTPQPTTHCRRKNGYFQHEDVKICDKFYYCVDGMFNMITCPDGLVYNEKTGICTWPDEAKKKGCSSEDVFSFKCPKHNNTAVVHPRYPDPEDCQFFYVCINGEIPRRNGCMLGKVFNEVTGSCDAPKNVPECLDWYKGVLTDAELERLNRPKPTTSATPTANSNRSRRPNRPQKSSSRVQAPVEEDEE